MTEQLYRQCTLQRIKTIKKAWIPIEFAKVGKFLCLKGVNGWKVMSAGQITQPESYFERYGRDYLHQRKASDI